MKIGSKIALFYTGITICMLTCIMVVFYFFIYNYINRLYDSYLADKAYLTAQKHWEKDEANSNNRIYLLTRLGRFATFIKST